jgi:outer membrane receptor for ferrienterochelin and colicin
VFVEDRGQVDFSASYDLTDSITLVSNVTNLLGEPTLRTNALGGNWKYSESDRRFSFGVRASF